MNLKGSVARRRRMAAVAAGGLAAAVAGVGLLELQRHNREEFEGIPAEVAREGARNVIDGYYKTSPVMTGAIGAITESDGAKMGLSAEQRGIWQAIALKEADVYGEFIAGKDGVIWSDWDETSLRKVMRIDKGTKEQASNVLKRIGSAEKAMAPEGRDGFKERHTRFQGEEKSRTNAYERRRMR